MIMHWVVGHHETKNTDPKEWYKAIVPGAVQLDYADGKNMGDYNYGENWREYLWMENVYWTYKTSFPKPSILENQRCLFVSKGIDYKFEILLNDSLL